MPAPYGIPLFYACEHIAKPLLLWYYDNCSQSLRKESETNMKLTLETERLILRPFTMDDAQEMFTGWASDEEVARYVTWPVHETIETTKQILAEWVSAYEKPERLNFAVTLKESRKMIGGIDVVGYLGGVKGTPVIGYALSRKYWNKGYMTEACRCLLDYLFRQGYDQVRIDAMAENTASNRVIQKCGGVYLKTEEEARPLKGDVVSVNRYVIYSPNEIRQ